MSKKRCITVLLCLLTASVVTASFFLIPEFRSLLTGLLMLFSQRSVQSLQGAINASAFPFFYAAFPSFIQRFLCWFPPRQIIAAVFCLGIFPGMAASLAGGSAACLLCYFIGRLLPVRLREKRLSKNIKGFSAFAIGLGVSMTFLGYSGPACLLLGALRLSSPVLIWGCFIGMLSEVAAYSLLCSPHSSFLPNNVLIIFRVAGVVLLCAALISAARKYSDI